MHVTEAESLILRALWRRGPLSPRDLIDEVRAGQPWGEATVKTLLGRLLRKGAIEGGKQEGGYRYVPVLSRQAYRDQEVQSLVDRVFDGRREALIAHLASAGGSPDGPSLDSDLQP